MTAIATALLNHVWQSMMFAAAAALLAVAFRRAPARVRHGIWVAASLKFLVPLTWLIDTGAQLGWFERPPVRASVPLLAAGWAASPFVDLEYTAFPVAATAIPASTRLMPLTAIAAILLAVSAIGSLILAWRRLHQWRTLRRFCRESLVAVGGPELTVLRQIERRTGARARLPLLMTAAAIEPGLLGLWRPVLLWPQAMSGRLTTPQIEAVVVHELSHRRRHDNLAAALHMVVEVVFWWQPMVWWVGARLLSERERACDEAVLRHGSDPQAYAESILKTCQFCLESPLPCVAGIAGADLKRRIEQIMTPLRCRAVGWPARLVLCTTAIASVGVPVLAGAMVERPLGYFGNRFFQNPRMSLAFAGRREVDRAATADMRFASAIVTSSDPSVRAGLIRPMAGGRFVADGVTALDLIRFVYSPDSPLLEEELDGVAPWMSLDRFNIVARGNGEFVNDQNGVPSELLAMLGHLLADRFAVQVHMETRDLPVYALVRARDDGALGPGLRPSVNPCWRPADGPPPPGIPIPLVPWCATSLGGGAITGEAVTLRWIANTVGAIPGIRRVIVDRTGLTGRYDIALTPGRSVFAALEEQWGLRLVPDHGPVDVIVITHAARPTTG